MVGKSRFLLRPGWKNWVVMSQRAGASPRFSFYDLDYTLIPFDTFLLLANYVIKRRPWRIWYLLLVLPLLPFAAAGWIGSGPLKEIFLSFLAGIPRETLDLWSRDLVHRVILPRIYPEMRALLEEHKKEGRIVVLNTASPSFYARYIGEALGVDHFFGTDFHLPRRMPLIPRIVTRNNKRAVKVLAMMPILPGEIQEAWKDYSLEDAVHRRPRPEGFLPGSVGLSDSSADLPMLELAEECILVHPDRKFAELGQKRGWRIVHPEGYTHGGLQKYLDMTRMVFGLYPEKNRPDFKK